MYMHIATLRIHIDTYSYYGSVPSIHLGMTESQWTLVKVNEGNHTGHLHAYAPVCLAICVPPKLAFHSFQRW